MRTAQEWAKAILLHTDEMLGPSMLTAAIEEILADKETVPGLYYCPKCGFQQSFNVISPSAVFVDPTKRDYPCPNDGSLLEPMTWQFQANSLAEALLKAHQREQEHSAYYGLLINELTLCGTCEGSCQWTPECPACLGGAPGRCTCSSQKLEVCPQCSGTGRDFHGSALAKVHWDKILKQRLNQQPDNNYGN